MRTPGGNGFDGPFAGNGDATMVTQFVRPPSSDSSALALDLSRNVSELSVWVEDDWRSFKLAADTGPAVVIPPEAWQGETLTVRYSLGDFFGDPNQLSTNLVPVTNAADAPELLPAGETGRRQAQFVEENFNNGPEDAFEGAVTVIENPDGGSLDFEAEGFLEGSFDSWQIDVVEGDQLDIRMEATGGGGFGGDQLDPELILRDGDGVQVDRNDDFDGLNSRIQHTVSESGQFEIVTRSLSGAQGGGPYRVTVVLDREEAAE